MARRIGGQQKPLVSISVMRACVEPARPAADKAEVADLPAEERSCSRV
jgi:hypothetical protein